MSNQVANKSQFKVGQSYGNDCTVTVISRTAKTLTIKSTFGTQRIKIRDYDNNQEVISFKCWLIDVSDIYNKEESLRITLSNLER